MGATVVVRLIEEEIAAVDVYAIIDALHPGVVDILNEEDGVTSEVFTGG